MITAPSALTSADIEDIEKQTLRWIAQALFDYGSEIWEEFRSSPDDADGVAEDVTQDSLSRLQGFTLDKRRLYGTVDYRCARYAILVDLITRQALFVDSKAEQSASSGRLQLNQTSLRVLFRRPNGTVVDVPGGLADTITLADGSIYLTTTMFAHYHYAEDAHTGRTLRAIKVAALPNGQLETSYVTSPTDTIWNVGPDAPQRGEAQRARLSFHKLKAKANWRVQTISFSAAGTPSFTWDP